MKIVTPEEKEKWISIINNMLEDEKIKYHYVREWLNENCVESRPALSGEVTEMQIKHHLDTINNCSKVFFEITKCARLHAAKEITLKKYKELEFFKTYVKTSSLLKPQEPSGVVAVNFSMWLEDNDWHYQGGHIWARSNEDFENERDERRSSQELYELFKNEKHGK